MLLTIHQYLQVWKNVLWEESFDNNNAATTNNADATDSALQSAQLKAIDICKWCTASGAAVAKQTSERRLIKLSTNQQSTSKSAGHIKQGYWQQLVA